MGGHKPLPVRKRGSGTGSIGAQAVPSRRARSHSGSRRDSAIQAASGALHRKSLASPRPAAYIALHRNSTPRAAAIRENAMEKTKTWILGVAGGLLMTMATIAALDAYVTKVQRSAPRIVVEMERVTVTADPVDSRTKALAGNEARKAAAL